MAQETLRENKMGTMPENRLLLSMAVPMMISMLVQALYNIVDSIFVSRICEDALTAVSMAFPLQNIIISIAVGFGVGINEHLDRGQRPAAGAAELFARARRRPARHPRIYAHADGY